jgi:competence protein ComFC
MRTFCLDAWIKTIEKIKRYFLDFLFPLSPSLQTLTDLTAAETLLRFLRAREIDSDTVVLFDYKDPQVKSLIWEIKYNGNKEIAAKVATILFDVLEAEIAERTLESIKWSNPLLIPLPISSKRRRERGWNQTELIGDELEKLNTNALFEYKKDLLHKTAHTESQARTHATKRERDENLRGSMHVKEPANLTNKAIILLDDVTTSGATFREAKRALKEKGAKKIILLAVAH